MKTQALLSLLCAVLLSGTAAAQSTATDTKHRTAADEKHRTAASPEKHRTFTALLQALAAGIEKRDTLMLAPYYATEYRHYTPNGPTDRKKELAFIASSAFPSLQRPWRDPSKWPTTAPRPLRWPR
jgi:hypothetical protein